MLMSLVNCIEWKLFLDYLGITSALPTKLIGGFMLYIPARLNYLVLLPQVMFKMLHTVFSLM